MSKYYYISGKVKIHDLEKFKYWLFEELHKQDLVDVFDINIKEASKGGKNMMFKAANQEKIRSMKFLVYRRVINYPEFKELYAKYTLPKWYKEIDKEAVVDTLAKTFNNDFGSHYTFVDSGVSDEGTPYIVIMYGDVGSITYRYAFSGQMTIDTILNKLIELHFINYGQQRLREVIDEFLESRRI